MSDKIISSIPLRETDTPDTTLFETHVRQNSKRAKRKVVNDSLITPQIFGMLTTKVYTNVEDIYHITQREVIEILRPLKISNKTIARVINEVIPDAKATQGSVASMIRFIDKQKTNGQNALVNELIRELTEDL